MSLNIELIKASFEQAKPIAQKIADKFYEFLWEDYPTSKALFDGVKMDSQKKALINSLVFIVENLEEEEKLVQYLSSMGERHLKYGTQEEHYDWVGASLLKTFAFFFQDEWTDELEEQWSMAYNFIAQTMIEGAKGSTPELSLIRKRAKNICNDLLLELLNEGIDEEFENFVRLKVRKVLFKVLEEESERLLNKAA